MRRISALLVVLAPLAAGVTSAAVGCGDDGNSVFVPGTNRDASTTGDAGNGGFDFDAIGRS